MDWSIFFSLVGIVIILALMIWGSRWVTKRYSSTSSSSKHIKIIDRAMLGQDKSIVLADICDSKYIIGVSGQQITLLKDIGKIDFPVEENNPQEDFVTIFSELLKKKIGNITNRFKGKAAATDGDSSNTKNVNEPELTVGETAPQNEFKDIFGEMLNKQSQSDENDKG